MAGPRPTRGPYPDETGPPVDDLERPTRAGRAGLRYADQYARLTHTDRLHPAVAAILADDATRAAHRDARRRTYLRSVK